MPANAWTSVSWALLRTLLHSLNTGYTCRFSHLQTNPFVSTIHKHTCHGHNLMLIVPGDTLSESAWLQNQPACIAIWHATQIACCCSRQWAVRLNCRPLCTHTSAHVTPCYTLTKIKPACPLVDQAKASQAMSHKAVTPHIHCSRHCTRPPHKSPQTNSPTVRITQYEARNRVTA